MNSDPVLAVAIRAARRAGSVLVDAARDLKRLPSFSNEHHNVVSAAETDAEDAIVATLRTAFPDHAILGREAGAIPGARGGAGFKWLIDPLDGSRNFVRGYPYYATSIALARGRDITHAVVLDPVRDEMYAAVATKGAQLNGTPLRVSSCTRVADALIANERAHTIAPGARETLFNALASRCAGIRRAGACTLDLCYVASGRLDGMVVTDVEGWDLAGASLIVKEAGGRVGDFAGAGDFLDRDHVIAATNGLFAPLREAIAAAVSQ